MGVPTFYRWLSCRYPRVVVDVGPNHAEDLRREKASELRAASSKDSVDEERAAKLAEECGYDCLYLDMNGIIHPCCHSDDGVSSSVLSIVLRILLMHRSVLFRLMSPSVVVGCFWRSNILGNQTRVFLSKTERLGFRVSSRY